MSHPNSHPHFDDHGAHNWFVTLEGGVEQAKKSDRLLFVEFGRKACTDCRNLVEVLLPNVSVREQLASHFVTVAADADSDDPAILALVAQVENATTLPYIMFADAEAKLLYGFSGPCTATDLVAIMDRLIAQKH
ncbi:MAG: thioredoxin family protein [Planctomycetes bacterium]|nr:thioredoxin family protein [Planctomycetota bacterium]